MLSAYMHFTTKKPPIYIEKKKASYYKINYKISFLNITWFEDFRNYTI